MKKNTTQKMILITLLFVMIALVLVASTYAKYTSNASGSASARVAKWSFNIGTDNDIVAQNAFKFNLFDTINDTDGNAETDVISSNNDKVIAPGTQGNFNLVLENKSEISAKYGIVYTVTNEKNIPIKFSTDGQIWSTDLAEVVADNETTKIAAKNGTKTINIQWKWEFDGDDTQLGKDGTATVTVKADVTATQID